jgi:hypothetical protein
MPLIWNVEGITCEGTTEARALFILEVVVHLGLRRRYAHADSSCKEPRKGRDGDNTRLSVDTGRSSV